LLASEEGRVFERGDVHSLVWRGRPLVPGDRSLDVFVRKLRQKLERASPEWRYLHTHFGRGYRFAAEMVDVDFTSLQWDGGRSEGSVRYAVDIAPDPGVRAEPSRPWSRTAGSS
jgi:DNA-binding winged helix-turn-helix (wHTH) protein